MAAKTAVFVGEATVEAEITDSLTNHRLAAGVDRRIGTKTFKGMTSDWADVEGALDFWAERIARRVAEQKSLGHREIKRDFASHCQLADCQSLRVHVNFGPMRGAGAGIAFQRRLGTGFLSCSSKTGMALQLRAYTFRCSPAERIFRR